MKNETSRRADEDARAVYKAALARIENRWTRRAAHNKATQTPAAIKTVSRIAADLLDIDTLETRNSDGLDFHDVSVASLKAALVAAYEAGRRV